MFGLENRVADFAARYGIDPQGMVEIERMMHEFGHRAKEQEDTSTTSALPINGNVQQQTPATISTRSSQRTGTTSSIQSGPMNAAHSDAVEQPRSRQNSGGAPGATLNKSFSGGRTNSTDKNTPSSAGGGQNKSSRDSGNNNVLPIGGTIRFGGDSSPTAPEFLKKMHKQAGGGFKNNMNSPNFYDSNGGALSTSQQATNTSTADGAAIAASGQHDQDQAILAAARLIYLQTQQHSGAADHGSSYGAPGFYSGAPSGPAPGTTSAVYQQAGVENKAGLGIFGQHQNNPMADHSLVTASTATGGHLQSGTSYGMNASSATQLSGASGVGLALGGPAAGNNNSKPVPAVQHLDHSRSYSYTSAGPYLPAPHDLDHSSAYYGTAAGDHVVYGAGGGPHHAHPHSYHHSAQQSINTQLQQLSRSGMLASTHGAAAAGAVAGHHHYPGAAGGHHNHHAAYHNGNPVASNTVGSHSQHYGMNINSRTAASAGHGPQHYGGAANVGIGSYHSNNISTYPANQYSGMMTGATGTTNSNSMLTSSWGHQNSGTTYVTSGGIVLQKGARRQNKDTPCRQRRRDRRARERAEKELAELEEILKKAEEDASGAVENKDSTGEQASKSPVVDLEKIKKEVEQLKSSLSKNDTAALVEREKDLKEQHEGEDDHESPQSALDKKLINLVAVGNNKQMPGNGAGAQILKNNSGKNSETESVATNPGDLSSKNGGFVTPVGGGNAGGGRNYTSAQQYAQQYGDMTKTRPHASPTPTFATHSPASISPMSGHYNFYGASRSMPPGKTSFFDRPSDVVLTGRFSHTSGNTSAAGGWNNNASSYSHHLSVGSARNSRLEKLSHSSTPTNRSKMAHRDGGTFTPPPGLEDISQDLAGTDAEAEDVLTRSIPMGEEEIVPLRGSAPPAFLGTAGTTTRPPASSNESTPTNKHKKELVTASEPPGMGMWSLWGYNQAKEKTVKGGTSKNAEVAVGESTVLGTSTSKQQAAVKGNKNYMSASTISTTVKKAAQQEHAGEDTASRNLDLHQSAPGFLHNEALLSKQAALPSPKNSNPRLHQSNKSSTSSTVTTTQQREILQSSDPTGGVMTLAKSRKKAESDVAPFGSAANGSLLLFESAPAGGSGLLTQEGGGAGFISSAVGTGARTAGGASKSNGEAGAADHTGDEDEEEEELPAGFRHSVSEPVPVSATHAAVLNGL
ncbi:unnamed protein product [Amoebophrya sp. A120]|nr:unnamed protein product [Amoebophrya sp. A120]|eukprot:GSA120T00009177001.1